MPIWIIVVDLTLAVLSFLCGLGVAYFWFTLSSVVIDEKRPVRAKLRRILSGLLISTPFFGAGLYDLWQLSQGRLVPAAPTLLQTVTLACFALCALLIYLIYWRHRRVQSLIDDGQTEEAIALLEGWIRSARKPRPDLHSMLGMIHLNSDRPEQAAEQLRRAVEISGELPTYQSHLAIALNNLGRTDEALELIGRAAEKDPANRWVYTHNRCYFLAKAGRVEQARELLQEVERFHQQQITRMPPLDQRRMAETLSEMQQLCDRPATDFGTGDA